MRRANCAPARRLKPSTGFKPSRRTPLARASVHIAALIAASCAFACHVGSRGTPALQHRRRRHCGIAHRRARRCRARPRAGARAHDDLHPVPFRSLPGDAVPGRPRAGPLGCGEPLDGEPVAASTGRCSALQPRDHHAVLLSHRPPRAGRAKFRRQTDLVRRARSRTSWPFSQRFGTRTVHADHATTIPEPRRKRDVRRDDPDRHAAAAEATPAMLTAAIRNVVAKHQLRTGKVKLDIPPLVENGNTVPLTVRVDEPDDSGRLRQERSTSSTRRTRSRTSATSISAPPPAAPRSRPASGSPTPRRWWRSHVFPTTRSGRSRPKSS